MSESHKPTHVLKVMTRDGKAKAAVGVGWANTDGSMSISLNPCSVLDWRDNLLINLFPIDRKPAP